MDEKQLAEMITEALYENDPEIAGAELCIESFQDKGVLTNDEGLVIKIFDDTFYLTIQKR